MAFPTIPTTGAGRVLVANQLNTTATRTFPSLSGLTKNSGDLLIAICVAYQTSTGTNAAFSGWTGGFTEFHDSATSTTMAIGMAYKWSDGTETGTFAVTQAGTITGDASFILLSIPGAHASTPPEAGSRASGTTSAADPASFDPSGWAAEDTLWISVVGSGCTNISGAWDGTGTTAPTNYTNRVDTNASDTSVIGDCEAAVAFRQLNGSSENVGTAGVDVSNARNAAVVIAVRPAAILPIDGAIDANQGDDVADFAGTFEIPGSIGELDATQGGDTADLVGSFTPPPAVGEIDAVQAGDSADLTGTHTPPTFTGTVDGAQADDTADLAGTVHMPVYTGDLSPIQADDTADLIGTATPPTFTAVLDAGQTDDIANLDGTSSPPVFTGAIAATQADDVGAFTQSLDRTGTIDALQQGDTADLAGSASMPVYTGVLASVAGADIADLTGTFTPPPVIGPWWFPAPVAYARNGGGFQGARPGYVKRIPGYTNGG